MTCLKCSRNLNLVCRGISPTQCTNFKTLGLYCLKSSCTWFPQFTHVYKTDLIAISQAIQICIKHGLIIYAQYPLSREEVMLVIIHRWLATHNTVRNQRPSLAHCRVPTLLSAETSLCPRTRNICDTLSLEIPTKI